LGLTIGFVVPSFWNTYREWRGIKIKEFDRATLKKLLAYGLPLTATFALNFVVSSSDRIMLGWLQGTEAAGFYAVGYDLAQQTLGTLMMVVNLAAYPLAVQALERGGVAEARGVLRQNVVVFHGFALPITMGLIVLAPDIANIFLGPAFRAVGIQLMPWIACGIILSGTKSYYLDLAFQLGNHTLSQIWPVLLSAIINVLLNLWWIPKMGLMGAAYSTVIAFGVALAASLFFGHKIFPLPFPWREISKIIVAALVMGLTLLPLGSYLGMIELLLKVMLGSIVYGLFVLAFDIAHARKFIFNTLQKYSRR
jgi:O-antigen/teichoic acid export membrane protein